MKFIVKFSAYIAMKYLNIGHQNGDKDELIISLLFMWVIFLLFWIMKYLIADFVTN